MGKKVEWAKHIQELTQQLFECAPLEVVDEMTSLPSQSLSSIKDPLSTLRLAR